VEQKYSWTTEVDEIKSSVRNHYTEPRNQFLKLHHMVIENIAPILDFIIVGKISQ